MYIGHICILEHGLFIITKIYLSIFRPITAHAMKIGRMLDVEIAITS